MAARMDIALQRNEDWARTLALTDGDGAPIDLSGCSVQMQVKSITDNTAIVAQATCAITNAAAGEIVVTLLGGEGSPLNLYGSPIQTENLRYDIRLTDEAGYRVALLSGTLILSRGVTQNG